MAGGKASGLFTSATAEEDDWPQEDADAEDIRDEAASVPQEATETVWEEPRDNTISAANLDAPASKPEDRKEVESGYREIVVDIDTTGLIQGTDRVIALAAIELIDGEPTGKAFTAGRRRGQGEADKKLLLPEAVSDFMKFLGTDRVILHDSETLGFLDDELTKFGYRPLTFSHAVVSTRQVALKVWGAADIEKRFARAPGDNEAQLRAPRVGRLYSALTGELDAARGDFERAIKSAQPGEGGLVIQAPAKWRPTVPSLGASGKRQRVDLDLFEATKAKERVDYFWKDRRRYEGQPVPLFSTLPEAVSVSKVGLEDRDAVAAALQLGADKFGPLLELDGEPKFIATAIEEIARRDLPISLRNTRQQERLNEAQREWARRREAERLAEIAADSALKTEQAELLADAVREWSKEFELAEVYFADAAISPEDFGEWAANGAERLAAIKADIESAFSGAGGVDEAIRASLNVARTTAPGAKEAAVPIALDAARDKLLERTADIGKSLQAFAAQAPSKPHHAPIPATTYQDIA